MELFGILVSDGKMLVNLHWNLIRIDNSQKVLRVGGINAEWKHTHIKRT